MSGAVHLIILQLNHKLGSSYTHIRGRLGGLGRGQGALNSGTRLQYLQDPSLLSLSAKKPQSTLTAMNTSPPTLSSLSDPTSLAKLRILVVPIQQPGQKLSEQTYHFWSSAIRRHAVLRGDELKRPNPTSSHTRGSAPVNPRARFLPPNSSSSISRGAASNHVHLDYPTHPPARHLSPLSLLRFSLFPLIVVGIAVDPQDLEQSHVQGYSLGEDVGDIGQSSTPVAPTLHHQVADSASIEDAFQERITELFPPSSPFPLVKKLLLVGSDIPSSPSTKNTPRKAGQPEKSSRLANGKAKASDEVVSAPSEGIEAWISRLLGELVGDVFGELGELATALETPSGLKTLSSTLLPSLTATMPQPTLETLFPGQTRSTTPSYELPRRPNSSTPVSSMPHSHSVDTLSAYGQSGMGISLKRALTPGGRPTSVGPPSLPPIQTSAIAPPPAPVPIQPASSNPFRRSTAIASPFSRASSAASISTTPVTPPVGSLASGSKYTSAPLTGVAGGRILKMLGDMYLMAGMFGDAIQCYDDGAEKARNVGDVLWEGLAREGRAVAGIGEAWEGRDGSNIAQPFPSSPIPVEILTHFLSSLACISRSPLPFPPTLFSPSPQAASGSISFAPSSSSSPTAVGTGEGLLAYLHTGLALRISHFVMIIWAAGGWGSIALSTLVTHSFPRSFPPPESSDHSIDEPSRRKRTRTLNNLSAKSQLSRQSIFAHAEEATGPQHRALTKTEQLALFVEVAWLARYLDLPRKEAHISRDVVKRTEWLLVSSREAASRKRIAMSRNGEGSANTEANSASVGLGLGMAVPTSTSNQVVTMRRKESTKGNASIIGLIERIANIMGVDLLDPSAASGGGKDPQSSHDDAVHFGWPELQVETIKEAISVAESLPDQVAVIKLCITALNRLHPHLNTPSQVHLNKMIATALGIIKRRGLDFSGVEWWLPGRIVLSLELASLPPNRLPVEHSPDEIVTAGGKKDPFLYNPRVKAAEAGKTVLVAGEQTDIFVTLQNPFAFELEIQDVSLITSGVSFTASPLSITLAPTAIRTVRVTGLAPQAGTLHVKGVSLRLPDGSSTEVMLPLVSDKDKEKEDKRRSRVSAEAGKVKKQGLDARRSMLVPQPISENTDVKQVQKPEPKWLECRVVQEQPLLWIKKTSLTHGTVMLYDGETSTIRITLENSSATAVDFVKLSFEDSTTREAQALLADGEVSLEQAYELEHDITKRPVFTHESEEPISIPAGGRSTVVVRCLGKVGCTNGTICIDYGCLSRSKGDDETSHAFHTRQITFPVLFTVYHTLEPHSLDITRLPSLPPGSGSLANGQEQLKLPNGGISRTASGNKVSKSAGMPSMGDALLGAGLRQGMDGKHCLVALNIRNVYGVPFEVTLQREAGDDGIGQLSATRLVPPGATERIMIPLPRMSIPLAELQKPIPALSERQYVVDKTKKTLEQVHAEREVFWFRERLLSILSATWIEPGSRRSGFLTLREQVLSPSTLEILRLDDLDIVIEAKSDSGGDISMTDFVDLVVSITNNLDRPIRPYVRLEALPSSSLDESWAAARQTPRRPQSLQPIQPIKNVVFDGSLTAALDILEPGAIVEYSVGAVFLSAGSYHFRSAIEEIVEGPKLDSLPLIRFSDLLTVDVKA